jgi:hypothetical protein
MHSSVFLPNLYFLIFSLFGYLGHADNCPSDAAGSELAEWCKELACSSPTPADNSTGTTVIAVNKDKTKRSVWDNSSWIPSDYQYQVSPYYKPAAVLRACSGSVVTTYDTVHANLNGRGQSFVSQRNLSGPCCANSDPIRLFSGRGDNVTIIKEDIFFPGGVIHIADK